MHLHLRKSCVFAQCNESPYARILDCRDSADLHVFGEYVMRHACKGCMCLHRAVCNFAATM